MYSTKKETLPIWRLCNHRLAVGKAFPGASASGFLVKLAAISQSARKTQTSSQPDGGAHHSCPLPMHRTPLPGSISLLLYGICHLVSRRCAHAHFSRPNWLKTSSRESSARMLLKLCVPNMLQGLVTLRLSVARNLLKQRTGTFIEQLPRLTPDGIQQGALAGQLPACPGNTGI
ncbi:hypothetical protein GQ54DRAFT_147123 [Martensiomyces pterosporus]|nr:hypothetical protein GQ54DRAFT_147123 [Martensiomyces pterosporus]